MQFPQYAAHADMEERHWWFLARRQILRALLHEILPPSKSVHLIDVGCGTGGLTHFLSEDYHVTGIDPSADAIMFARERFPSQTFIHGYAPKDVPDFHQADAVLLIEVLEHIEHDQEFVRDLLENMKPGAVLVMMAPADMSLWGPHDDAFEHFRRYDSREEFRNLWKGTDSEELLVSFCNSRLYPVVKLMRKLSALRGKAWGKGGTDIGVPMKPLNVALRKIYESEAPVLHQLLRGEKRHGLQKGVSLIAILRKHL